MQKYRPVVTAHEEESVFSGDEPPDDLSNQEQSALNIYSYKQHQMGSAAYIYIYTHVYKIIIKGNHEFEMNVGHRVSESRERESG